MLRPISGSRTALSADRMASSVGMPSSSVSTSANASTWSSVSSAGSGSGQPPWSVVTSLMGDTVRRTALLIGQHRVAQGHPPEQRALDAHGEPGHALEGDAVEQVVLALDALA